MKLLVTGCAGFVGSNFCYFILEKYPDDTLIGVDCLTYAADLDALAGLQRNDRFRFYKEDICNAEGIDRIFQNERPDVLINFAAESHVDNSIIDATRFVKTNVVGTQVLLDASLRYNVKRFHQVSTDEVYGDLPLGLEEKFSENSLLNPSSPYSASKASADLLALSYMRTHGMPVSISRCTNNYGIYQHSEKLIPMTINRLLAGEPVPVYGDGLNMRDWIWVGDHCSAVDLIIRAGECGIYNIGADNEWSNIDLISKIISILGVSNDKIFFVEDRKGHDRRYPIDSTKIRSLGWKPEAGFERALKDVIKWYSQKDL